jgi:hypothetical protein
MTQKKLATWIPFGGGDNRCVGAAFATMESDITLRTLLRELRLEPADAPGQGGHWRGVATVPAQGARAVVLPANRHGVEWCCLRIGGRPR